MEALGTIFAGWSDSWNEEGIRCIPSILFRLVVVLVVCVTILPVCLIVQLIKNRGHL